MKKVNELLLGICRKIETLKEGVIAFAYLDGNENKSHTWYCVCLNDYEMYTKDKRFIALSNAWRKAGKALGVKIIFACCYPSEEKLGKLLEEENLWMNV